MMQHDSRTSSPAIPLLIVLGGILVIVSFALHWGRVSAVSGGGHVDVKGGTVVLIAGIIGVALGLLFWMMPSKGAKMTIGVIAIVGGLLAVAIALAWALSKDLVRNTVADKLADQRGLSHAIAERQLRQAENSGTIKTSTQPGVWLALGGGLLVLLGGIGGVSAARKLGSPSVPPPPGMPFQGTDQPTGGPLGAPPPPSGEPGPPPPDAGGTGTGPAPPLPPDEPPKPGEPGATPGFRS